MSLLAEMVRSSFQRFEEARERVPEAALRAAALGTPTPPPLKLERARFRRHRGVEAAIPVASATCRRATIDPVRRLEAYAEGGAAVCSILTEPTRFDGDLEHLRLAAETLQPYGVPAMRKDFLVDPYQVLEARAYGASGVLLIVRMVPHERLVAMMDCAAEQGLFVLLEAFSAGDLKVADQIAREREGRDEQVLMGLNCRDLDTLEIDFRRFAELRGRMPLAMAVRGGERRAERRGCRARGVARVSARARRHEPDEAGRSEACGRRVRWTPAARPCAEMPVPRLWIKICGMRTREAIEAAAQAGADAVGFVFHEASPRNLTIESASALQSHVPAGVERVAVFLHPSQDLVDDGRGRDPAGLGADGRGRPGDAAPACTDSGCCRSFAADRRGPRCCRSAACSRAHAAVRASGRTGRKRRASRR